MKKILLLSAMIFAFTQMTFSQSNVEVSPNYGIQHSTTPSNSKAQWLLQFNYPTSTYYSTGAETDGTYIYTSFWSSDVFYYYDMNGVFVDSVIIPGVSNVRDLAYDGTYFYGSASSNSIFVMDFLAGTLVSTITAATGVTARHIAYDPINDAFWCGSFGSDWWLVDKTTGATLQTVTAATHGLTGCYGSAYDTTSVGGPFLWIFDQANNGVDLVKVNPTTGVPVVNGTHDITAEIPSLSGDLAGGLFIHPGIVAGTTTLGGCVQNTLLFGYNLEALAPSANDAGVSNIDVSTTLIGGNVAIEGEVMNFGLNTVTSFDLAYSINGATPVTMNITGVSLATNATYSFTHTPWAATTGNYTIDVWTSMPNGIADDEMSNDTMSIMVSVFDSLVNKKVLIEEATGAWCGYCPDGALKLQDILDNEANAVGCALHNGDDMVFADGNTVNSAYAAGYPNGFVDRVLFAGESGVGVSRSAWYGYFNQRVAGQVPMEVSATHTYDASSRTISIDVEAAVWSDMTGDYRVNCFIVEDSVSGTGSGYNQSNSYNTTAGHPLQGLGNPIIGYQHRHVCREMLGGPWGTASIIPAVATAGSTYTKSYTYTVPPTYKTGDIYLIAVIQKYSSINDREIINVEEYHLDAPASINETENLQHLNIYPNPVIDNSVIEFSLNNAADVSVNVYDILGNVVASVNYGQKSAGKYIETIDMSTFNSGMYFVQVQAGSSVMTKKIFKN